MDVINFGALHDATLQCWLTKYETQYREAENKMLLAEGMIQELMVELQKRDKLGGSSYGIPKTSN